MIFIYPLSIGRVFYCWRYLKWFSSILYQMGESFIAGDYCDFYLSFIRWDNLFIAKDISNDFRLSFIRWESLLLLKIIVIFIYPLSDRTIFYCKRYLKLFSSIFYHIGQSFTAKDICNDFPLSFYQMGESFYDIRSTDSVKWNSIKWLFPLFTAKDISNDHLSFFRWDKNQNHYK